MYKITQEQLQMVIDLISASSGGTYGAGYRVIVLLQNLEKITVAAPQEGSDD